MSNSIICIGDNHLPFLHKPSFEKVLEIIEAVKPKHIVDMGDKYDMLSFSRFPARLEMVPKDEILYAREMADEMWRIIRKRSKKSKCWQLRGNHDERARLRCFEKFAGIYDFLSLKHLWEFDGVETIQDTKQELVIDDIVFMHGYRKHGDHFKHNEFKNTVVGHLHTGGVVYHRIHTGEIRWELNAGYLGDPFSSGLLYRNQLKFFKWTHGVGLIDEYGPRFIPFGGDECEKTTKEGRV